MCHIHLFLQLSPQLFFVHKLGVKIFYGNLIVFKLGIKTSEYALFFCNSFL